MERQAGENRRKHVYVCAGFFGRGGGANKGNRRQDIKDKVLYGHAF